MASSSFALPLHGSVGEHSTSHRYHPIKSSLSSTVKDLLKTSLRADVSKTIKNTSQRILDAFVDSVFQFVDQPLLPSQKIFAPVEEIGEAVEVICNEGNVPADFPQGIYIRNGPNPLFGGLKSTVSVFGRTSHIWIEGEGMLHALYFMKNAHGDWSISYKNRYVESETFKLEKQGNKPAFVPTIEGDSPAILAAALLNMLRFGMVSKQISNTSIFEHSGKFYASKDPRNGELVIMGIDAVKPFFVVGVVSEDGKKLSHKVDLKFDRATLIHELGITEKYTVIMDFPLTIDINRLIKGGPLIKYEKEGYARIGVMPRYGNADSVQWFDVEKHCLFHNFNSFEDGNEVVIRGCRSPAAIIPGPDHSLNKFEWFSKGLKPIETFKESSTGSTQEGYLFARVKERNLTGTDFPMDFPMINEHFRGVKQKYGYTQVRDCMASSSCGSLAKLYFEESDSKLSVKEGKGEHLIKVEYHRFAENNFCSGSVFVPKGGSSEEDDGWIVSFVPNEDTDVSQVHIFDAKKFRSKPIAKITLPQRVPYGFHGIFITMPHQA
ncbi:hypothetical protein PVL29_004176 [Vitis rotundifolia]|uniref:Uncharacterized protein n=1 Tax=Vitis rotundifolia TaxID=103349 RepID=A0AA39A892_VITRO|nr:hypothetical protein PVL29_004176 [Vitis rotundifolia]